MLGAHHPVDRSTLRKLLESLFPNSTYLDAFCIDFYPEVFREFASGMETTAKINILLVKQPDATEILSALERHLTSSRVVAAIEQLGRGASSRPPHQTSSKLPKSTVRTPETRMSSSAAVPIRIVVAGRANAGKTTLLRTLLKVAVGDVHDRAGVTDVAKEYDYQERTGLPAIFVDTPGFMNAQTLNALLRVKSINQLATKTPNYELAIAELDDDERQELEHDLRAIKAIESGDVIIYVASLESAFDPIAKSELKLVTRAGRGVIGVLNKSSLLPVQKEDAKATSQGRIENWSSGMKQAGILNVVDFDAHWDRPSKVASIYNAIAAVLEGEQQRIFMGGIRKFNEKQERTLKDACKSVAVCVESCIGSFHEHEGDYEYDSVKTKSSLQMKISQEIRSATEKFSAAVSEFYRIRAESADKKFADENVVHDAFTNLWDAAKNAALVGVPSGGMGAIIGAGIGAIIAGALSGGLGAAGGAVLGAEIGGAIAGTLGSFTGTAMEYKAHRTSRLSVDAVWQIECNCLATIWALSHHGFGLRPSITIKQLEKLTGEVRKSSAPIDAYTNSREERLRRYEKILGDLEDVTV